MKILDQSNRSKSHGINGKLFLRDLTLIGGNGDGLASSQILLR